MTTVLLVDDVRACRALLRHALTHAGGFEVVAEAGTAVEALAACEHHQPDLVLLDVGLPDESGITLLPRLIALRPGLHVVIVSGEDRPEEIVAARQAGAEAFVLKPIAVQKLLATLEQVTGQSRPATEVVEAPAAQTPRRGFDGLRVLVIEEDPLTGKLLGGSLESRGAVMCGQALTLSRADHLLASQLPDVVFLGLTLPDGLGLEWLAERRATGPMPPTLIVSDKADLPTVAAAAEVGAAGFLLKPLRLQLVYAAVEKVLPLL